MNSIFYDLETGPKMFKYLFYRYEVGKSQSILLNIDESDFQLERFEY